MAATTTLPATTSATGERTEQKTKEVPSERYQGFYHPIEEFPE